MSATPCGLYRGRIRWNRLGLKGNMIEKENRPARIHRLRDLATRLGRELALWQPGQHQLEPADLAVYREALLDAIQGLDKGAGVLEKVLVRLGMR